MQDPVETGAEMLVVALAQTGDKAAFTELVRRRQEWIRNLMRRLCGEHTLAEDLAQQTFLQAWREITKLREPQKFPGWLKRIAINVWLKHQRKHDPLFQAQDVDEIELPQQTLQQEEQNTAGIAMDLDGALANLAHVPRLCIVLAYHEGMSHAEIADLLNLPEGTVKSHVRRGSARLRDLLAAYEGNRGVPSNSEEQKARENPGE